MGISRGGGGGGLSPPISKLNFDGLLYFKIVLALYVASSSDPPPCVCVRVCGYAGCLVSTIIIILLDSKGTVVLHMYFTFYGASTDVIIYTHESYHLYISFQYNQTSLSPA